MMFKTGFIVSAIIAAACATRAAVLVEPANDVVFTRASGAVIAYPSSPIHVWCGPWDSDVPQPAIRVWVGNASAHWEVRAVRSDVVIGAPMSFPNTFIFDAPRNADVFATDSPNEVSTQTDGSSGSIVFEHVDCNPGGSIRFRIDAVIGSEFGDGPSITARGRFSYPLTRPPN